MLINSNSNPNASFLPQLVEPTDAPGVAEIFLNRQKSLERALLARPELQSSALKIRNRELQLRYAEGTALRAVTDYNNTIAKPQLAEGSLLENYDFKIEWVKKEPGPWWAKF